MFFTFTLLEPYLVSTQAPFEIEALLREINAPISSFAWGWPTVLLIAFTGVFLMLRLGFMPLVRLSHGVRIILKPGSHAPAMCNRTVVFFVRSSFFLYLLYILKFLT